MAGGQCGAGPGYVTLAERLLVTARLLAHPRDRIFEATVAFNEQDYAWVRLALRFYGLPKSAQLRAIVEGWDRARVIQEVY